MTAEELYWHRDADHRFELVRGELRTAPFAHVHEGLITAQAGTSAVVVVAPRAEVVSVHRLEGSESVSNVLEVDDIVPGWKMPLTEIFGA